jgi:hypothetical protein
VSKYGYRKSPQYAAFEAYMAAPFSELPKDDMGRDDPRRMCFIDDMGVPEELIFMLWQASRRAALEEAAKVCDDLAIDRWNLYKGRPPYNGTEDGRANSYVEGESDGADKCSDAIRKLATETNNG